MPASGCRGRKQVARDNSRSQSFAYDALNRIWLARTQATTGANAWGQAFGYDPWGNLLVTALTQGAAPSFSVAANAQNQIVGYCYDPAGNLLDPNACPSGNNPHTYTYNAEGQMISAVAGAYTYTYDGDGRRVQKSGGKLYWYGTNGDVLAESDLSGTITDEYVFFRSQRIARRDAAGNVDYYLSDQLGSSRVVTDSTGNLLDDCDFYPFGWDRCVASSSGNTYKFTGKERDSESSLDDFGARYYGSSLGRFMSPDPLGGHTEDPQTLNKYAYVRNNPMSLTDPSGLDFYLTCTAAKDNGQTCQQVQNGSQTAWVQGATINGSFVATVISNDENGNLVDQNGNQFAGRFDQSGVHFSSDSGIGGSGQFVQGSRETDVFGSGIYLGTRGQFIDACGGSCQARGSIQDWFFKGAVNRAEGFLDQRSEAMTDLDRLSGAHDPGPQWMDSTGLDHVIRYTGGKNKDKTELHFEGHPVKGWQTVPHVGDAIWGLFSGRAAEQRSVILP